VLLDVLTATKNANGTSNGFFNNPYLISLAMDCPDITGMHFTNFLPLLTGGKGRHDILEKIRETGYCEVCSKKSDIGRHEMKGAAEYRGHWYY
jgi:hypothetical protein